MLDQLNPSQHDRPRTHSARRAGAQAPTQDPACHEAGPAIGNPTERAEAMLPEQLLNDGEIIVMLLKPSAWYLLLSCAGVLGVLWSFVGALVWFRHGMGWGPLSSADLLALGAILSIVQIGWQSLEWLSRNYILTDRRVIRTRGVVRLAVYQATFQQLEGARLVASSRERVVGLGSIAFFNKGSHYPSAHWLMLRQPQAVYDKLIQTIERYGHNGV
jgi:hypothetical protein